MVGGLDIVVFDSIVVVALVVVEAGLVDGRVMRRRMAVVGAIISSVIDIVVISVAVDV